jgi:hypothetical protein
MASFIERDIYIYIYIYIYNFPFNSTVSSLLNGTFNISVHQNIFTTALIYKQSLFVYFTILLLYYSSVVVNMAFVLIG